MDPLDEDLKAAMRGLEAQASDRYFDELPSRVMARLEESMQSDVNRPGTSAAGSVVGSNGKATERQEDSGLHDLRALAETTKQRMSQRKIPTVNPPVDHDVLNASSASLRAVALPEPAKMVALEIPMTLAAGTRPAQAIRDNEPAVATAAATASAFSAAPARSKAPMIIAGTVAFAAAAGAIGYFGFMKKDKAADPGGPVRIAEGNAATVTPIETAPTAPTPTPTAAAPAGAAPAPADVAGTAPIAGGDGEAAAASGALLATADDAKTKSDDDSGKARRDRDETDRGAKDKGDKADKADKGADKAIAPATASKKDEAAKKDDAKKAAADKAAADAAKPAPGPADKQEQSLDDLLKGAGVDTSAPKPEKPKLDKKGLDAGDIRKTMSALNGKAQGCYAKFGVTGSVAVKLTVEPSGSVTKTVVTGAAKGTPSGDCVAEIAATASFPPWDGAPMTVNYSYFLSE